jgi:hypothetical protein
LPVQPQSTARKGNGSNRHKRDETNAAPEGARAI